MTVIYMNEWHELTTTYIAGNNEWQVKNAFFARHPKLADNSILKIETYQ